MYEFIKLCVTFIARCVEAEISLATETSYTTRRAATQHLNEYYYTVLAPRATSLIDNKHSLRKSRLLNYWSYRIQAMHESMLECVNQDGMWARFEQHSEGQLHVWADKLGYSEAS